MSQRGRHYYNPITQVPESVEGAQNLSRVELFQDPADPSLRRWCYRLVNPDGSIGSDDTCDFDKNGLIAAAREQYPALEIFELQDPGEDSTWEGMGPSPRLWAVPGPMPTELPPALDSDTITGIPGDAPFRDDDEQLTLRVVAAAVPGNYVLIDDLIKLFDAWTTQFEESRNPSGASALREAIEALSELRQ